MAGKKTGKEGKKPHKNKPTSKKYTQYSIQGNNLIRKRFCPRCGPGVFLLEASNRVYCGKCHYSEFTTKGNKK